MISEDLQEGIDAYRIGEKIRSLRLKKSMGLAQLTSHCGLSPGMLSKIERGRLVPTLPSLMRIGMVFGVGLEFFFDGPRTHPLREVVRRAKRIQLPSTAETPNPSFMFESLDFLATERRFNTFYAEFLPGQVNPARHSHRGCEFLYVLSGKLEIVFEDETVSLGRGDSIYFDASHLHGYRRVGRTATEAVVVTSP